MRCILTFPGMLLCSVLWVISCRETTFSEQVLYVDMDVATSGKTDGSSWERACQILEEALVRATNLPKPIEIRVAQGIYKPGYSGSTAEKKRGYSFKLINGVALRGGFAGFGEKDPNARDITAYRTILSGDHKGDDVSLSRANDLFHLPNRSDNSRWVVTSVNADRTAVLEGFTIIGGYHNLAGREDPTGGGGLNNYKGSPTVIDCTFIGNCVVDAGGAVYNYECPSPLFVRCTFQGNYARDGGGMFNLRSNPTLVECVFLGNYAQYMGGGIMNSSSNPTLINCRFVGNIVRHNVEGGGGVFNLSSKPIMNNCLFVGNVALVGAGISNSLNSSARVNSCICWGNLGPAVSGPADIQYSNIQGGWPGNGNINSDPCFASPGHWDTNGMSNDPNDDFWIDGDYHLKSQAGRWDTATKTWVQDEVTSPCIDAGDPNTPVGFEPFPNGGRINMGAYGGTAEASKSYFGKPTCETIIAGDINGDCRVDLKDVAIMAGHWLEGH